MWSTALDYVIHSIRSCDPQPWIMWSTVLDHVIHVQYWMCAYDWSICSATAIKFMEKNRMGDQTLCSAFSPGKHMWGDSGVLLLKLNQQWYQVWLFLFRWQVFCDWRYRSYHPCVYVYPWSPDPPGRTHRTHGEQTATEGLRLLVGFLVALQNSFVVH